MRLRLIFGLALAAPLLMGNNDCGGPDECIPPANDPLACEPDAPQCTLPSSGLYATFKKAGAFFNVHFTSAAGKQAVRSRWISRVSVMVPHGNLVCGSSAQNCDRNWEISPSNASVADVTAEVCDYHPASLDNPADCNQLRNDVGTYCPWSSELLELRDCDISGCPVISR